MHEEYPQALREAVLRERKLIKLRNELRAVLRNLEEQLDSAYKVVIREAIDHYPQGWGQAIKAVNQELEANGH